MSKKQIIYLAVETDVFTTEEKSQAEEYAAGTNGEVYCWKKDGNLNWLEKGISESNCSGLIVLPQFLPEYINMPDDSATGK